MCQRGAGPGFPEHVFPLGDDPVFDALDFGVSGRVLARGGAFALQNGEGLALDIVPAGALWRVRCGMRPGVVATRGASASEGRHTKGGGEQRKRARPGCDRAASDDDGQFGDDENDAVGEQGEALPEHMQESLRGNAACVVQDEAGRGLFVHAGGSSLQDVEVSRLQPGHGGQGWKITRILHGNGGDADSTTSNMDCDEAAHRSSRSGAPRTRRILQLTSASHGDPDDLAWIAARSRADAAIYRLRRNREGCTGPEAVRDGMELSREGCIFAGDGAATASIVLNPHWGGEAALLDCAGSINLWNGEVDKLLKFAGPGPDLRARALLSRAPVYPEALSTMRRVALDFGQLTWGMHPRTILCAQAYRLSLLDLRSPNRESLAVQELLSMPCAALAQAGRFYAICGCAAAGASHEFATVSTSLVSVFDIRQPSLPMVRWLHHQEYDPPRHLSVCSVPEGLRGRGGSELGARMLVTGNDRWGEVICYQYGPAAQDSALMALEQPRKLVSLGDCNPWPGDSTAGRRGVTVLHAPDSTNSTCIDFDGAARQDRVTRRLAGLALSLYPGVEASDYDFSAAGSVEQNEAWIKSDMEKCWDKSGLADQPLVGAVLQMAHTGEVFASGLCCRGGAGDWPGCQVECSVGADSALYGEQGFQGWLDSEFQEEDGLTHCDSHAVQVAVSGCQLQQGGAVLDGSHGTGGNGLDAMVDDLADSASNLSVNQSANGGTATKAGALLTQKKSLGTALPRTNWLALGKPAGKEKRDLSKVFAFAAGLRGFDGKVAEGARLPDPPSAHPADRDRVCEICGFRNGWKRFVQTGKDAGERSNGKAGGKNRTHVCSNCNSAWHSKCIAKLYATRRELDLKQSRKVPKTRKSDWVCPQCTFYAEDRAREQHQSLTHKEWRSHLRSKSIPVPITRDEPNGGAWGLTDGFVHDIDRAFQGLGVANLPVHGGGAAYIPIAQAKAGEASSRRDSAENAETLDLNHDGGTELSLLCRSLAPKLVRFIAWPPKTMLEILVHVRRDLGMAQLSLADLASCLADLSSLSAPSSSEPAVIAMHGHASAVQAAAMLLAKLPDSEGMENVWFGSRPLRGGGELRADACASKAQVGGAGRETEDGQAERARRSAELARQLCCCVYACRAGMEQALESWQKDAAPASMGAPKKSRTTASGNALTGVTGLSEEQVRQIFMQRPKDQYQDVTGEDGKLSTRLVFDQFNRRMPNMKRRPGHPTKRPDGKYSLMQILAKKYNVQTRSISSIWMRQTRRAVTNSIKGAFTLERAHGGGDLGQTDLGVEDLENDGVRSGAGETNLGTGASEDKQAQVSSKSDNGFQMESDCLPAFGNATPVARLADANAREEDGAGEKIEIDTTLDDSSLGSARLASGPRRVQMGAEESARGERDLETLLRQLRTEWDNASVAAGLPTRTRPTGIIKSRGSSPRKGPMKRVSIGGVSSSLVLPSAAESPYSLAIGKEGHRLRAPEPRQSAARGGGSLRATQKSRTSLLLGSGGGSAFDSHGRRASSTSFKQPAVGESGGGGAADRSVDDRGGIGSSGRNATTSQTPRKGEARASGKTSLAKVLSTKFGTRRRGSMGSGGGF